MNKQTSYALYCGNHHNEVLIALLNNQQLVDHLIINATELSEQLISGVDQLLNRHQIDRYAVDDLYLNVGPGNWGGGLGAKGEGETQFCVVGFY